MPQKMPDQPHTQNALVVIAIIAIIVYSAKVYAFNSLEWVQRLGNIGSFLSGAGLLLLALQYFEQNKALKIAQDGELRNQAALTEQSRGLIYSLSSENHKLIISQPNLLPYFQTKKPLPAGDERLPILAAAELIVDSFELIHHAAKSLDLDSQKLWLKYMNNTYINSSAVQEHIRTKRDLYNNGFLRDLIGN